jgi:hypothetical protein
MVTNQNNDRKETMKKLNLGNACYRSVQRKYEDCCWSYLYEIYFHYQYSEAFYLLSYHKPTYVIVVFKHISNHTMADWYFL